MRNETYSTEAEILILWSWLRATEWNTLPGFLSQIYLPILLLYLPYWKIGILVIAGNTLWSFVRYRFVNLTVATWVSNAVNILKWPISLLIAGYFLVGGRYGSMCICQIHSVVPVPGCLFAGQIGRTQQNILNKLFRVL